MLVLDDSLFCQFGNPPYEDTGYRGGHGIDTLKLDLTGAERFTPRLLSENGSCYISGELAEWLEDHKMDHVRGVPFHLLPVR